MSVFSKIKCALGFSPSEDEDEEYDNLLSSGEETVAEDASSTVGVSAGDSHAEVADCGPMPEPDEALTGKIFDETIRLFNEWQPEFVSSCLNTEAQRAYLLNAIDEKLRQSLHEAVDAAKAHALAMVEVDRRRASEEVTELKKRNDQLEEKRKVMKTAQLSADRQKRALSDRVHDLEGQVAQLEAEKEQYQLENRSMLNKLRVASLDHPVHSADSCDTVTETTTVATTDSAEVPAPPLPAEDMVSRSDHEAELSRLSEELDRLKAEITRLTDDNTRLTEENVSLTKTAEEAKARATELDDIRKRRDVMVAQANASAHRLTSECESLRNDITDLKDKLRESETRLHDTESRLKDTELRLRDTETRLNESEERFKAARTTVVEAEERIKEATAPRRRRGRPAKSSSKSTSQPSTSTPTSAPTSNPGPSSIPSAASVSPSERSDGSNYSDCSKTPDTSSILPDYSAAPELMNTAATVPPAPEASVKSKRKVKPAISAIDELLDGSDWMVSTPPPPPPAPRQPKEPQAEDDFGYKAPPRRQHIDNDAQMSLW